MTSAKDKDTNLEKRDFLEEGYDYHVTLPMNFLYDFDWGNMGGDNSRRDYRGTVNECTLCNPLKPGWFQLEQLRPRA